MSRTIDVTGRRYGSLIVLRESEKRNRNKNVQWVCQCDCGNEIIVEGYNLRSGHTTSCGCFQKLRTSEATHKTNKYQIGEEYGVGFTSNTGQQFIFDTEDFDLIKDYSWFENDEGYIVSTTKGKTTRMHRLIMNATDGEMIDHINNNRKDNRKLNLRLIDKQKNSINRGCNKNSTTGVKGVSKYRDRFIARIGKDGKTIYIGSFNTIDEAKEARHNMEVELFGEYAYNEPGE